MAQITCKDLILGYEGVAVVSGLSFEVKAGEYLCILGENGSGKTTTIKAILGLIHPDSGSVVTLGKEAGRLSSEEKSMIGAAMADSGFSSYLTVNDIRVILRNMFERFEEDRFTDLCQKGGLPFDKQLHDFSTGMQAKLKTIVACSHQAKLLILDEPLHGLDARRSRIAKEVIGTFVRRPHKTLIMVSHYQSEFPDCIDRSLYLHRQA